MASQSVADMTSKAASRSTLIKLTIFSLSLISFPITSFFVTKNLIWNGNDTYAAITAVVVANVVLFSYIFISLLEDQQSLAPPEAKKKEQ